MGELLSALGMLITIFSVRKEDRKKKSARKR